jgi:hypothetical protein
MKYKIVSLICLSFLITSTSFASLCDNGGCDSLSGTMNTNQSQYSQQGQGQSQGLVGSGNSSSNVNNSGNSSVSFNNSFNGSKPIRYTPVPTDVLFGNTPSLFTSPLKNNGPNFIPARNIIDLMYQWNAMDISDDDFDVKDVNIDITFVGHSIETDVKNVTFCIQGSDIDKELKAKGYKPIAIGSIKTDDVDINSPELYMALVHKAKEIGAHNVVLMTEGVKLELTSSGWGIGASYNYASVNSDLYGQGSVGAGGTGYSKGKASYNKFPFLTFAFIQ